MKEKGGSSSEYAAGQAFYWAPGHAPEALEHSEYVDFSATADFEKVIAHVSGGGQLPPPGAAEPSYPLTPI